MLNLLVYKTVNLSKRRISYPAFFQAIIWSWRIINTEKLFHFRAAKIFSKTPVQRQCNGIYDNITIEFMFVGINMFWAELRLILAQAVRLGLKKFSE